MNSQLLVRVLTVFVLSALSIVARPAPLQAAHPTVKVHRLRFFIAPALAEGMTTVELQNRLSKYAHGLNAIFEKQTVRRLLFDPAQDVTITDEVDTSQPMSVLDLPGAGYEIWVQWTPDPGFSGDAQVTFAQNGATVAIVRVDKIRERDNPEPEPGPLTPLDRYFQTLETTAHEIEHGFGAGGAEYTFFTRVEDETGVAPIDNIVAGPDVTQSSHPFWQEHSDYWTDPLLRGGIGATPAQRLESIRLAELTVAQVNSGDRSTVAFPLKVLPDLTHTRIRVTAPDGDTPLGGMPVQVWESTVLSGSSQIEVFNGVTDSDGTVHLAWTPDDATAEYLLLVKVLPPAGFLPAVRWVSALDAVEEATVRGQEEMVINVALEEAQPRPVLTNRSAIDSTDEDAPMAFSHGGLVGALGATDPGGLPISLRIERVVAGSLTRNGEPVAAHATLFRSGDTLEWTPPANRVDSRFPAFIVRAHNGHSSSVLTATVHVFIAAVSHPPVPQPIAVETAEDTLVTIAPIADELAGHPNMEAEVSYQISGYPQHGTATFDGTNLMYAPAADYNGPDQFTYVALFQGVTSVPASVTVNVTAVQDSPRIAVTLVTVVGIEDQAISLPVGTLLSSAGVTHPDFPGVPDVNNLKVTSLDGGTLRLDGAAVTVGQVIQSNRTLVWTPAANLSGTAKPMFRFRVVDVLGVLSDATASVKANITPVNDAPTFSVEVAKLTASASGGAVTIPGVLSPVSVGGGGDERSQSITAILVGVDHPKLFSVQPTISIDGTLRFTPKPFQAGTATLMIRARDDGGTANGGIDTSNGQPLMIQITM